MPLSTKKVLRLFATLCVTLSTLGTFMVMAPDFNKPGESRLFEMDGKLFTTQDFDREKEVWGYIYKNRLSLRQYIRNEMYYLHAVKNGVDPNATSEQISNWIKNKNIVINLGSNEVQKTSAWSILQPYVTKYFIIDKFCEEHSLINGDFTIPDANPLFTKVKVTPLKKQIVVPITTERLQNYYRDNITNYQLTCDQVERIDIPIDIDITDRDIQERYNSANTLIPEKRSGFLLYLSTPYSKEMALQGKKAKMFPEELTANILHAFEDVSLESEDNKWIRALYQVDRESSFVQVDDNHYVWLESIEPMRQRKLSECKEAIVLDLTNEKLNRFYDYVNATDKEKLWRSYKSHILYLNSKNPEDRKLSDLVKEHKYHTEYDTNFVSIYRLIGADITINLYNKWESAIPQVRKDYISNCVYNLSFHQDISKIPVKTADAKEIYVTLEHRDTDALFVNHKQKQFILQLPNNTSRLMVLADGRMYNVTVTDVSRSQIHKIQISNSFNFDLAHDIVKSSRILIYPQIRSLRDTV